MYLVVEEILISYFSIQQTCLGEPHTVHFLMKRISVTPRILTKYKSIGLQFIINLFSNCNKHHSDNNNSYNDIYNNNNDENKTYKTNVSVLSALNIPFNTTPYIHFLRLT